MSTTETKSTFAIDPELLARFEAARLYLGHHDADSGKGCAMDWASFLAKEPWSDHPACVCPSLTRAFIRTNDRMNDQERDDLLKQLVPLALGTAGAWDMRMKRVYILADWAVRSGAPMALRARGRGDLADRLEKLPEVVDTATARAARDAAREVRAGADAYATYAAAAYAAAAAESESADAYADAYAAYATEVAAEAAYAAAADAADAARRAAWVSFCAALKRACEVR